VSHDLVLVGGGLANSLIALRLGATVPDLDIALLEQGDALGGNHTWSFHTSDVSSEQLAWLRPLIVHSWESYDIFFPERRRRLSGGYHTITSERLHRVVADTLGDAVKLNARVERISDRAVELHDGRRFEAPAVVDGRGDPGGRELTVRYQKFLGHLVALVSPHGLQAPILMDVNVEQLDGFRFLYTLPFGPSQLLVEDTRYSDEPSLPRAAMRQAIAAYIEQRGWTMRELVREEEGVLPVVLGGDIEGYWASEPGVPRSGVRAGLFHYTTGYSLPQAVSLADQLAAGELPASAELYRLVRRRSLALWRRGRFFRVLNRMLFLAAQPAERYRVLQHFYRLPEPVIHRFYAGRPTVLDKIRILSGEPPVPVGRALRSLLARSAEQEE
jgi:lycopene beta-cyclase